MEVNPVVILGGGLWGALLAYRMKSEMPHVRFKFYESKSKLNERHSWSFTQAELGDKTILALKPFLHQSWATHSFEFPGFQRQIENKFHMIRGSEFYHDLKEQLADNFQVKDELNLDEALMEGCFVIDARSLSEYKGNEQKQFVEMEVELASAHNLTQPVMMASEVAEDCDSYLQIIPVDFNKLLIRETRYLQGSSQLASERSILSEIERRGWRVEKILHKETGLVFMSHQVNMPFMFGRTINIVGGSLADSVDLIDRLINASSFRLGELKNVVQQFQKERMEDRKFTIRLNELMFKSSIRFQLFSHLYQLPQAVLERWQSERLTKMDRMRILSGKPLLPLLHALNAMYLMRKFFPPQSMNTRVLG